MAKVLDKPIAPPRGDQDMSPITPHIDTAPIEAAALAEYAQLEEIYLDLDTRLGKARKLEIIHGRIVVREMPTGEHNDIVFLLLSQLLAVAVERGWKIWNDIAIFLGPQMDRYRPDLTVVPANPPMWGSDQVHGYASLLAVEVVSKSSVHDDHVTKPKNCAAGGVPLLLVIDGFERKARLFSRPAPDGYEQQTEVTLGAPLELPEPWGFTLDTGKLGG
ncbi:Uma2 family endonuclease [Sphaerisporangium sp. NPDC005288]|uniref:Uma2 family endonuclease n=1 Tax=Sphaerisporangium sp. NPDC005288 TaxID=3155114 RepID=UPI0033A02052